MILGYEKKTESTHCVMHYRCTAPSSEPDTVRADGERAGCMSQLEAVGMCRRLSLLRLNRTHAGKFIEVLNIKCSDAIAIS